MTALLNDIAVGWWQWTLAMSVQVTLVVAAVALLDRLLARWAWPQLLSAVWMIVLIKLLVPPTLHSPASVGRLVPARTIPAEAPVASGHEVLPTAAFLVWGVGSLAIAAWAACRYRGICRQVRRADRLEVPSLIALATRAAARLGLRRVPDVCVVQGRGGPAVVGFVRPIVVLPESFVERASPQQIEHALLHEFSHIRRRDPLSSLFCQLVQVLYWFHPVVWLVRRRLTTLREISCDHTVARALGENAHTYRRTLLELARPHLTNPRPIGGLPFMYRHSQIIARLTWLSGPVSRLGAVQRTATAVTFLVLALLLIPLAPRTIVLAPVFETPPLSELSSCLELRYAVLRALAEQQQNPPTSKNTS